MQTFTVVCPPWPAVIVTKTCACKGTGTVTYTVTKPVGIRVYTAQLVVDGVTQPLPLGKATTVPLKAGTSVQVDFTARDKTGKTLASGVLDGFTQH